MKARFKMMNEMKESNTKSKNIFKGRFGFLIHLWWKKKTF